MLSSQTIQDKNDLNTDAVILSLLEINIPSTPIVYLTNNNENVIWNGNEYIALPYELEDLGFTSKSEVTQWSIKISNVNRIMSQYTQQYDAYLKKNGIDGNKITCIIRAVNSKDLSNPVPIIEYKSFLSQPKNQRDYTTFVLTPNNVDKIRFPPRTILKNQCTWKFKSQQCGYVGDGEFCDKTLTTCREYNNSPRFGGFVGVGGRGVILVD
jgi:lambda family phage minor tail protein L